MIGRGMDREYVLVPYVQGHTSIVKGKFAKGREWHDDATIDSPHLLVYTEVFHDEVPHKGGEFHIFPGTKSEFEKQLGGKKVDGEWVSSRKHKNVPVGSIPLTNDKINVNNTGEVAKRCVNVPQDGMYFWSTYFGHCITKVTEGTRAIRIGTFFIADQPTLENLITEIKGEIKKREEYKKSEEFNKLLSYHEKWWKVTFARLKRWLSECEWSLDRLRARLAPSAKEQTDALRAKTKSSTEKIMPQPDSVASDLEKTGESDMS